MSILYVTEKEEDGLEVARAFKRAAPHMEFRTVSSSGEVLAYLKGEGEFGDRAKHPYPALVLIDLGSSPMDAVEVVRWIRQKADIGRMILIGFSNHAEPKMIEAAHEAGLNSFIRKPSSVPELETEAQSICGYWLRYNPTAWPRPSRSSNN